MTPLFFLFLSLLSNPLQIEKVYYVQTEPRQRFDLSGILKLDKSFQKAYNTEADFILINDKSSALFGGWVRGDVIHAKPFLYLNNFDSPEWFDLEDIDRRGNTLFTVNEPWGTVYEINPAPQNSFSVKTHLWENNSAFLFDGRFGIEALGVMKDTIFLGKEMPPLALFHLALSSKQMRSKQKLKLKTVEVRKEPGSTTAIRYRDGFLYILDRDSRCLWKTKKFSEKGICYSFKKMSEDKRIHYRVVDALKKVRPKWGTFEGLDLDKSFIYFSLDNNHQALYADGQENRPAVVVVKAPKGFYPPHKSSK